MAVGAGHAVIEVGEFIVAAHEDGVERTTEFLADAVGHVEREVFFLLAAVAAHGTRVFAAVAGIEDDGFETLGVPGGGPIRLGQWTRVRHRMPTAMRAGRRGWVFAMRASQTVQISTPCFRLASLSGRLGMNSWATNPW